MSWQAMGAVQERSQFVGNSDITGFRVLLAIAWYADETGVAGRPGEQWACPSQRTIAERARVHRNTVQNWLPRLVEAGELALERYGAGRGAHTVYRILLPMAQPDDGDRVMPWDEPPPAQTTPTADAQAEALAQRLQALEACIVQLIHQQQSTASPPADEGPHDNQFESHERPHGGQLDPHERPHDGQLDPHERPHDNQFEPHERPHETAQKGTRGQRADVPDPLDPFLDPNIDPEGDPGGL